jgi:NAD(P)-dependent dehydrogenase (short-subunit alcohol dehydrogenase family)
VTNLWENIVGNLSGKVAIITGAGRGIGRGIAVAYGRAGAKVVVSSRSRGSIDKVVDEITRSSGTAIGITCNVGERDQVFRMVEQAFEEFGAVDILVNNAQSFGPSKAPTGTLVPQPLETFDEDEWEHINRTGLLSTLWGMKAVFPHMKDKGGKIINFGSVTGEMGMAGAAAYNATKEGIRALTRTAAREWGKHNITVNVINPTIRTDSMDKFAEANPEAAKAMLDTIPLGRHGDPLKDAGALAVFLGSGQSDYITGMTFNLDGGFFLRP